MPDDKLTPVQRSVLLILMAEAREVPNADLANERKLELKKDRRDGLVARGLIKVRRANNRLFLQLTSHGEGWCRDQSGGEVPDGAGHGGAAAYALLAAIQRYVDRNSLSLRQFFAGDEGAVRRPVAADAATAEVVAAPHDVEARIRKSYLELGGGPGEWVKLADLRPLIGEVARQDVDRILVAMNRTPEVSIVPESNQNSLSERERAAAVRIGNQDKHLISIGPS